MSFLRNAWYVGARVDELNEGILSRRICNLTIVMYRTLDRGLAALEDRCPHRFVPLSMGRREGDTLRCGYHGLRFDLNGNCVERPGGKNENPAPICVRSFPVVERYDHVWLWMGAPEDADPDAIPDFSLLYSPGFTQVEGHLLVQGNYELISDNLLDLSHVEYLHPEASSESNWADWDNRVKQDGETVWSLLDKPRQRTPRFQGMIWGSDSEYSDSRTDVRWNAPGVLLIDSGIAEVGEDIAATGLRQPSGHFLTPETEYSTHYFWVIARNRRTDDAELDAFLQESVGDLFRTQDAPMIEAQQAAMGESTDFLAHNPLILKADAAGVRARRVLRSLIRLEEGAHSQDPTLAARSG